MGPGPRYGPHSQLARRSVAVAFDGNAAGQAHDPVLPDADGGFSFRFVYVYTMPEAAMRQAAYEVSACATSRAYAPRDCADIHPRRSGRSTRVPGERQARRKGSPPNSESV